MLLGQSLRKYFSIINSHNGVWQLGKRNRQVIKKWQSNCYFERDKHPRVDFYGRKKPGI
jgi:hypothetical protein